jgi:hypothetical protein
LKPIPHQTGFFKLNLSFFMQTIANDVATTARTSGVRMFKVVIQFRGKPVAYPLMDGNKSLMERLSQRGGFVPMAHTSANGVDEVCTLEEMQSIYPMELDYS